MDPLLTDGDLGPFLSLGVRMNRSFRVQMERAIRAQCSEGVIPQVHDALYAPVKQATAPLCDAIQAAIDEALGADARESLRAQHRRALAELRRMLGGGAKERDLQHRLVDAGLLAITCGVVQEVAMNATEDHRGMRMDLVLESKIAEPTQVIELKRGSHLLLVRMGQLTERLSKQFRSALKQVEGYGRRLETDQTAIQSIEARQGIRIHRPELRLIAGRRLPDADSYHLLSSAESDAAASGLELQIYTWDGLLAELERIVG